MPGDDQCAFVNVNVKQLGTVYLEVFCFEDVILNHGPWSFISVSPKLNFAGSQVVTLLDLCDPLEGFNKNMQHCHRAKSEKQNGGHIWVKASAAGYESTVCLCQTTFGKLGLQKIPSLQSPPDLRFSYKLRTFSRNPGKVRSEGIVSPGDLDFFAPRKLMNKTYLI